MLELLMLGGKKKVTGMTYPQFLVWLNNNVGRYTADTSSSPSSLYPNAYVRRTVDSDPSGTMWGTPYLSWYTHDSTWAKIIRHAVSSEAVFNYILTNKQFVLVKQGPYTNRPSYLGINRNGYSSVSYSTFNGRQCIDMIYFDVTLGVVMRWNPSVGGTPVIFDGTLV